MATMTHRTTFALDEPTARRLRRLATRWNVSQAEVVRRSLEQAEKLDEERPSDAVARLQRLQEHGLGLDGEAARRYLREVREDREHWRGK